MMQMQLVVSWEAETKASASSGLTCEIPYTVNSRPSWTAKEEKSKKEKEIERLQQKVISVILLDQDSAKCLQNCLWFFSIIVVSPKCQRTISFWNFIMKRHNLFKEGSHFLNMHLNS